MRKTSNGSQVALCRLGVYIHEHNASTKGHGRSLRLVVASADGDKVVDKIHPFHFVSGNLQGFRRTGSAEETVSSVFDGQSDVVSSCEAHCFLDVLGGFGNDRKKRDTTLSARNLSGKIKGARLVALRPGLPIGPLNGTGILVTPDGRL